MKIRVKLDETEFEIELTEGEAQAHFYVKETMQIIEGICQNVLKMECERLKNQPKIEP